MKYLNYYYDTDGSLVINARVPAEQGAQLIKALEAGTDLLVAEQRRVSAEAPPGDVANKTDASIDPARVSAEASSVTPKRAESNYEPPDVSAEASRPPLSSIRVDALCLMAEGWLSREPTAVSDNDRYRVVVHVDEDAL
jgi:hypothetical protein